jgi:hypothetical protein
MTVKNVIFMENNIIKLKPFIEMGAEKLREEILRLVSNADEEYLKAIHMLMFRNPQEKETDWYDELDERTKKDIEIGLKQAEEGELIHNDEVMAEVRAKYKK